MKIAFSRERPAVACTDIRNCLISHPWERDKMYLITRDLLPPPLSHLLICTPNKLALFRRYMRRYTSCMRGNDVARTWHSNVATAMSIPTLSTLLAIWRRPFVKVRVSNVPLHNILPFRGRVTRITALNSATWRDRSRQLDGRYLCVGSAAKVNEERLHFEVSISALLLDRFSVTL